MGWQRQSNGKYKYIGKDGKPYIGWHKMGKAEGEATEHFSYFENDGTLAIGWRKFKRSDGETAEHWSYFGDNGWLRTGWQKMGTKANPDGNSREHWSYFGSNGWLRTGWQQMGKGTNNPDGNNAKHWSYFGANGWLRTGLQKMGTSANPDGKNGEHLSFFGDNGWLRVNQTFQTGGKTYIASANGWLSDITNCLSTFLKLYLGKGIDYDGKYGVQCVDLIKKLLNFWLGIKPGSWGDAHAYYDNFNAHKELTDNFVKIANTPSFVPKRGDIVVWHKRLGGTGHIAIATGEGDTKHFHSWDQNWGYAHEPMTRKRHDYSNVLGVLRVNNQALAA